MPNFWRGAQVFEIGVWKNSQLVIEPSHFGSCPSVQRWARRLAFGAYSPKSKQVHLACTPLAKRINWRALTWIVHGDLIRRRTTKPPHKIFTKIFGGVWSCGDGSGPRVQSRSTPFNLSVLRAACKPDKLVYFLESELQKLVSWLIFARSSNFQSGRVRSQVGSFFEPQIQILARLSKNLACWIPTFSNIPITFLR